jgi:antitoxin CptB
MDRVALERLKWKCRRGLLELDLVLERILEQQLGSEDISHLNELLDLPDNDLWAIVNGRSDGYERRFDGIVARLRSC